MSGPASQSEDPRFQWLPSGLRPRESELPGSGRVRLIETTLLVLVGLVLATATIYDIARSVRLNHRLSIDENTWRAYTGHNYRGLAVDQELFGASTQREVVCGNTSPGRPRQSAQYCLVIWGPVVHGLRTVHGGWYTPPHSEDLERVRYGCFGPAAQGLCPE